MRSVREVDRRIISVTGEPPGNGDTARDKAFISKLQTLQMKLDRNGYASSDYREQV